MFKFIHAADIHLDSPLRGLARYASAPVEAIRGASRRAFENLVSLAIDEQVAFVVLAGDLYDVDWKDLNTGIFLGREMGRLGARGIRVFAVAGNHDANDRLTKALDPPSNLRFLSTSAPETVRIDSLRVALHGQGFGTQRVDENLAEKFPDAEPGWFNIGLLHTSLDGREGHAAYAPCTADDLKSKGYQYWALGHVHAREVVSRDPWIVFPGCLQGRHVHETGPKGCVVVTVDDGEVSSVVPRFVDVLRWSLSRVDLQGAADEQEVTARVQEALFRELEAAGGIPVAARVQLEGADPMGGALAAAPDRLEGQVRSLAAELAGDDLWIEKVRIAASPEAVSAEALPADSPFVELVGETMAASDDVDAVEGLDAAMQELRKKLPPEARRQETGLDLEDPAVVSRIIREAKQLLLGRLLAGGGGA
jgi:DNA repair protein SbcD/Mre11